MSQTSLSMDNLHGPEPNRSDTALLLIDVINDLDFPENEDIVEESVLIGKNIARLKREMKDAGFPVIYVNDNFQKWQSNFQSLLEHCLQNDVPGRHLAELLKPEADDYFVLKPMHSGFYCTPLEILLDHLHVKNVVITGVAGNICVLFTANDAYMRNFKVFVPADCTASNTKKDNEYALSQMQMLLKADITPSHKLVQQLTKDSARSVKAGRQ